MKDFSSSASAAPTPTPTPTDAMQDKDNRKRTTTTTTGGVERRQHWIELGLLAFAVVYGSVYYSNPDLPVNPIFCEDSDSHSINDSYCYRPDLIAYKVCSLVAMLTMGLMGVYHWHFSPSFQRQFATSTTATAEDRLFGASRAADVQNVVILCYQIWDFGVSFTIPENMDPIFMVHHLLAMMTAYCSLEFQMVPYYSIFYGGCSEFSSIFLVFLDKDQLLSPLVEANLWMDQWLLVCKGMFFLTFSYYRIFGWIYYSFPLWKDCRAVMASGSAEQHRPGRSFFLRVFLGLDVVLGALQCYWYYNILENVAALFVG